MESIPKNDCQKIGYLQKPHGVRGELVLQMEDDYTESVESCSTIFLEIDGLLVPFFLLPEGVRSRSVDSMLVQFDWIEDEEQARKLCGNAVYLKQEDLLIAEDEIPMHFLIGFTLFDSKIGKIGVIEQVDDYAGNLILQVCYKKQEVLVPYSQDFQVRFDEGKKEIELECPDGIFEID